MPSTPVPPRPRVQSAARAVGILLAVAKSDTGLTTKELSEQLGLGRQTVYHLLHTLTATGMITRDHRNRHVLGLRTGTLAEGFARQLSPSEHLTPLVQAVARTTGETTYASGWWSGEITMFTVARGTNPAQSSEVAPGHTGDAHARASGKLLLATASPEVRAAYLDAHELTGLTPRTITTRDALDREFELIRHQGYAVDDEEFTPGQSCIAVSVDGGRSPFVVVVTAPSARFRAEQDTYLEALRDAVYPDVPTGGS